jgi:SOS-response transcriptional repressor LexA
MQDIRDKKHKKLSEIFSKNINYFLEKKDLNNAELARSVNISHSTICSMSNGSSVNPRLYTLSDLSSFLGVSIGQLIGESPLNSISNLVPVISWSDIDVELGRVNMKIDDDTKFLTYSFNSSNSLFAIETDLNISGPCAQNNTLIIEVTGQMANGNLLIVSIDKSEPSIRKFIKDGPELYLESLDKNIPIQQFFPTLTKIFGVVKEIRKNF